MKIHFGIDVDKKDFEYVKTLVKWCFQINEKLQLAEIYETNKGFHIRFAPAITWEECEELMWILSLVTEDKDLLHYFEFAFWTRQFVLRDTFKYQNDKGIIGGRKVFAVLTREVLGRENDGLCENDS